jgi:hypothetical protein
MALSKFVIEGAGTNFATIGFRDSLMEIVNRIHRVGYIKPVKSEVTLRVKYKDETQYFTKIKSYLRSKYKLELKIERRVFRMPPNYIYRFTIHDELFERYVNLESLITECETSLRLSYDTY